MEIIRTGKKLNSVIRPKQIKENDVIEFQAAGDQQIIESALSLPDDAVSNIPNQKEIDASRTSTMMLGIVLSVFGIFVGVFLCFIGMMDILGPPGEGAGFPFWLALLGGIIVIAGSIKYLYDAIRSKVTKLDQSTVEKAAIDYYSSVLDTTGAHGWGRPYSLLAQSNFNLPGAISFDDFPKEWIEVKERIADYFFQRIVQHVECGTCGKKSSGIWGQKPTSFIMKSTHFVKCSDEDCNKMYCFKCFTKLGIVRKCGCGKVGKWQKYHQLEPCGYDSVNFASNPEINVEEINDRISNVTVDFKGTTTIKTKDISEQRLIEFKSRFHNCALNIGSKWYVTQSGPGEVTSWEQES